VSAARRASGYKPRVTTDEQEEHDVPEGADTTGQGYPEEQPAGAGIDAREHPEDDVADGDDAPQTSPRRDGDAGQATGNPRAAGGETGH
jgi:hypothetical protein